MVEKYLMEQTLDPFEGKHTWREDLETVARPEMFD